MLYTLMSYTLVFYTFMLHTLVLYTLRLANLLLAANCTRPGTNAAADHDKSHHHRLGFDTIVGRIGAQPGTQLATSSRS